MPGLPERAAAEGLTPLEYMRRYGAFEIAAQRRPRCTRSRCPRPSSRTSRVDALGRVYTRAPKPGVAEHRPAADARARRRRPAARRRRGRRRSRCAASRRRAAGSSSTRARSREWGWPEARAARPTSRATSIPTSLAARARCRSSPTFRLPVQIHTRSANAKWLDEIAHTNPLWIHTARRRAARRRAPATWCASRPRSATSCVKAWVTEGIRPGVVACSHHMGRWKTGGEAGQRQMMADREPRPRRHALDAAPARAASSRSTSSDPDTARIWWTDAGVHQNLTFPVQPDPDLRACTAGTRRCACAGPSPATATATSRSTPRRRARVYQEWLARTRPADGSLARRHAPAVLAAAAAQAGAGGLPPAFRPAPRCVVSDPGVQARDRDRDAATGAQDGAAPAGRWKRLRPAIWSQGSRLRSSSSPRASRTPSSPGCRPSVVCTRPRYRRSPQRPSLRRRTCRPGPTAVSACSRSVPSRRSPPWEAPSTSPSGSASRSSSAWFGCSSGLLRAGVIAYMLSQPILLGFVPAAAILIIASQLPIALGVTPGDEGILEDAATALAHPGDWSGEVVALSLVTGALVAHRRAPPPTLPDHLARRRRTGSCAAS